MSGATPRVIGIFLLAGTLVSYLTLWATERWLLLVENLRHEDVVPLGLFGALALTLVWILPGQAFVSILAGLFFSFFKKVPLWFVLFVMIPACALMLTYRDISDRGNWVEKGDVGKLLYWSFVVAPGELLRARFIAASVARTDKPLNAAKGDGS